MKLVKDQGGYAIAVYQPYKKGARTKAAALIEQERANFIVPADYSLDGALDQLVRQIIVKVGAEGALSGLGNAA
jgi:hypothetical protein